jgi:hypothetical protein
VTAVLEGGLQVLMRGVRRKMHGRAPGSKLVEEGCRGVCTRRQGVEFVASSCRSAYLAEGVLRGKQVKKGRPLTELVRHGRMKRLGRWDPHAGCPRQSKRWQSALNARARLGRF